MLDQDLKSQLKDYLGRLTSPIELLASLDDSEAARQMRALLDDIVAQSDRITLSTSGQHTRRPSFAIRRASADVEVSFAGLPMGHEFTSLVLALLQVGGYPPRVTPEMLERIASLPGHYEFETYISLTCQNCPDVVQALNLMAAVNPRIRHTTIDGALFRDEIEARQVMAVPSVFLNGEVFGQGRMSLDEILARLDTSAGARDAQRLPDKTPYDVLIVGGGPAGAAAAVYAARKGIRTGIVAERFGGQVADTMGIENYIGMAHTEGPSFVRDLKSHVDAYSVDLIDGQQVTALEPAGVAGGLARLQLSNGASLQGRTIVLAPGARWRRVGVPGEDHYRNKGVAYCPHCDGPLFKGKRVAVIGGGNSGVEAAIDLAGLASQVVLLEFASQLRADAVLVARLRSLPNVTIHLNAQTSEITGDGRKVDGLVYRDRDTGAEHRVALEGVFVQIGLVPNTEWLKDTVALTPFGEIVVDSHGRTDVAGVFAAGDATTTPFKQIVIAAGEGSKAALSAFDYLMRVPATTQTHSDGRGSDRREDEPVLDPVV